MIETDMWEYLSTKQKVAIGGFVLALVAIPLTFSLLKSTQIFSSKASSNKTPTTTNTERIKTGSASAALNDLNNLLSGNDNSSSPSKPPTSPTPTSSLSISFGSTLSFLINMEGRRVNQNNGAVFVGIASGAPKVKPTYLLTFTVNVPTTGVYSGLSLAGLNIGENYTAYIKGPSQIDKAVQFTVSRGDTSLNNGASIQLTSGDLNEDNTINSADYNIAKNVYGITNTAPNWNSKADINGDGVVNNYDLAYIVNNTGKTGDSGIWYSPPPQISTPSASLTNPSPTGGIGGLDQNTHGHWVWIP